MFHAHFVYWTQESNSNHTHKPHPTLPTPTGGEGDNSTTMISPQANIFVFLLLLFIQESNPNLTPTHPIPQGGGRWPHYHDVYQAQLFNHGISQCPNLNRKEYNVTHSPTHPHPQGVERDYTLAHFSFYSKCDQSIIQIYYKLMKTKNLFLKTTISSMFLI